MGLIKAATGAAGGVLADQWREYIYCDSLAADVLAVKGAKRISDKRSSNKKAEDNIITNGSIIAVNEGQCMMIVDQGEVVELCAEPGEFVYDSSSEPSIFFGSLGEQIKKSFSVMGKRIGFGGDTAKDQRVYFFNTKEILGNKYGTPNPVPFRVVDKNIGLDIDISVRCFGEYSYQIINPMLFYKNVCGNIEREYTRDNIDGMLKSELMTALQPAFAKISEMGIRYSALPGHTVEIAQALNEVLSEQWKDKRGIQISSFGVSSVTAPDEDEEMIKNLQKSAVMRDPTMAAATIVGAQADAMRAAASNEGGAMAGFVGLGMAQQAGGVNAAGLYQMGAAPAPKPAPESAENTWKCSCGTENTANFCSECGKKRPDAPLGWTCECGTLNKGRFCINCGKKKPDDQPLYACDKCGWEPEDPHHPPKFCPECGDPFDDSDIR